jgi:hypothetical protein
MVNNKVAIPGKLHGSQLNLFRVYYEYIMAKNLKPNRYGLGAAAGRTGRMNNAYSHPVNIPYSR